MYPRIYFWQHPERLLLDCIFYINPIKDELDPTRQEIMVKAFDGKGNYELYTADIGDESDYKKFKQFREEFKNKSVAENEKYFFLRDERTGQITRVYKADLTMTPITLQDFKLELETGGLDGMLKERFERQAKEDAEFLNNNHQIEGKEKEADQLVELMQEESNAESYLRSTPYHQI